MNLRNVVWNDLEYFFGLRCSEHIRGIAMVYYGMSWYTSLLGIGESGSFWLYYG